MEKLVAYLGNLLHKDVKSMTLQEVLEAIAAIWDKL